MIRTTYYNEEATTGQILYDIYYCDCCIVQYSIVSYSKLEQYSAISLLCRMMIWAQPNPYHSTNNTAGFTKIKSSNAIVFRVAVGFWSMPEATFNRGLRS